MTRPTKMVTTVVATAALATVMVALLMRMRKRKEQGEDTRTSPRGRRTREKRWEQPGRLVTLPATLMQEAAKVAAAAFATSPGYLYICGGRPDVGFLEWLYSRNFWLQSECCRAVVGEDGRVEVFFMFVPPETLGTSTLDMVRAGVAKLPVLFGFGYLMRLLKLVDWFEEQDSQIMRAYGPMYHLERVCVRPDLQGKGRGTSALRAALDEADASGVGVFLTTQLDRNVAFYQRLGFNVVKEVFFPGYADFPNRYMVRLPPSLRLSSD